MSRYRKIDPRFWKDEKIVTFSPEEKLLSLYLFTGQSNRVGIFSFSPGEAAEDLGMLPETFSERFGNVCRTLNLGWDKTLRVLYIPTWWKYNPPENSNNVIGNLKDLDDVPKSDLVSLFVDNLEHLPESLRETFTQTIEKRYPQRSASQEQEQEQEQLRSPKKWAHADPSPNGNRNGQSRKANGSVPGFRETLATYHELFTAKFDAKPDIDGGDGKLLSGLIKDHGPDEVIALLRLFFECPPDWVIKKGKFTLRTFKGIYNELLAQSRNGNTQPSGGFVG